MSASTFLALVKLADLDAPLGVRTVQDKEDSAREDIDDETRKNTVDSTSLPHTIGLRYNVEIHLPASKDIGVYNAIFKSLKEHLLDS